MVDINVFLTDAMLINLIVGIVAGAIRSVVGWLQSGEDFEIRQFFLTLIRTSILGAMLSYNSPNAPIPLFFEIFFADYAITSVEKIRKVKKSGEGV